MFKRTRRSTSVSRALREATGAGVPDSLPRSRGQIVLPPRAALPIVGREDDLRRLIELMTDNGAKRVLLHGAQGAGKTSVALEVAHSLASTMRYDLVLWLDCQRTKLQERRPMHSSVALANFDEVLRELAIAIDADDALREPRRNQVQLLRRALSRRAALLVVDDLASIDDYNEAEDFFLTVPGNVDVLVTADRAYSTWPEIRELEPLSPESSSQLLSRFLEGHSAPATDLNYAVELGGGIPLAITWLAQRLRSGLTADDIRRELDAEARSGTGVYEYFIGRSWEELATQSAARDLFLLVAVAGPGLPRERARDVLPHLTSAAVAAAADRLVDLNLMLANSVQYSVLPVVREFTFSRAVGKFGDLERTLIMWATSLERATDAAAAAATWRDGFAVLDEMRRELFACLGWCETFAESTELRRSGLGIFRKSAYFMYCMGYWSDLVSTATWAVPRALLESEYDTALEGGLLWTLKAVRERDGLDAAQSLLDSWRSVMPAAQSRLTQRRIQIAAASLRRRDVGEPEAAAELSAIALELAEDDDIVWATRAMLKAGNAWSECGVFDRARHAFEWVGDQVASHRSAWASEVAAITQCNLGVLANRRGDYEIALSFLEPNREPLAQEYDRAVAHAESALAYWNLERRLEAETELLASRAIADRLGIDGSVIESTPGWDIEKFSALHKKQGRRALWWRRKSEDSSGSGGRSP